MSEDLYQRLRKGICRIGFPLEVTPSGVETRFLQRLFTEEEAEMYLHLTKKLETPQQIAERASQDTETTAATLKRMAAKGLLLPKRVDETYYYAAAPFIHGMLEHQVVKLDRELADIYEEYKWAPKIPDGPPNPAFATGKMPTRTIPVKAPVRTSRPIASYEDARQLLESQSRIAVAECFCAKQMHVLGTGCTRPREVCLLLGFYADYYVDLGWGRRLTKAEALGILDMAEEAGLVHQFADSLDPGALCNCCPDCCGALQVLRTIPNCAAIALSNHFSEVDQELCNGCGACVDRCPMKAISLSSAEVASINLERCIGCGLCVQKCPTQAIMLVSKPAEARSEPPFSSEFMRSSQDIESTLK